MDSGTNVIDIGLPGTEEIYFATFHLGVDGDIEVTASHNPLKYNGMKFVRFGAQPVSGDSGLDAIQQLAEENIFKPIAATGHLIEKQIVQDYIEHLISFVSLNIRVPSGAAQHPCLSLILPANHSEGARQVLLELID